MGLFKKAKEAAQGMVHVQGAGPIDPAIMGGPSTRADTKAALDGWVQRMGQSMAVGQQFRTFLGY
jgi:hypothetical protein